MIAVAGAALTFPQDRHVAGQQTTLERWTLGYIADGWAPRWSALNCRLRGEDGGAASLAVSAETELVSFRSALDQTVSHLDLSARLPVSASSGVRLALASSHWRTDRGARTLIETPRSEAIAIGLDYRFPNLGDTGIEAIAGWDAGVGSLVRVWSSSEHLTASVSAWSVDARESRVRFPADSLRTLGASGSARGVRVGLYSDWSLGSFVISPSAIWSEESLDGKTVRSSAFLTTSPEGSHSFLRAALRGAKGAWRASAEYRSRDLSLSSPILRTGASAGRLNQAALDMWGWSARVGRRQGERQWSLMVGSDQLFGRLSTRVETWPFASLWATLSAQAFRLNGDVAARTAWVGLRNVRPIGAGWSWGVQATHVSARVDRDSWYVTSFGFGRSDREITTSGVDPAVLIIGDMVRRVTALPGEISVRFEAGTAISARPLEEGPTLGGGFAGYVRLAVGWVR